MTKTIVQAAKIMGIHVHEHLIINMENSRYYSFAGSGYIKRAYDEINCGSPYKLTEKIDLKPHKNQKPLSDIENQAIFTPKQIESIYESVRDWCLIYNAMKCPEDLSGIEYQIRILNHFCKNVANPAFNLLANMRFHRNEQEHIRQMEELKNLNDHLKKLCKSNKPYVDRDNNGNQKILPTIR